MLQIRSLSFHCKERKESGKWSLPYEASVTHSPLLQEALDLELSPKPIGANLCFEQASHHVSQIQDRPVELDQCPMMLSHANVSKAQACFEHSNFFKVTAPKARPSQLKPGAHRRQKGRVDWCTLGANRSTQPKVQLRAF